MDFVIHGFDVYNIAVQQRGVTDDFKGFDVLPSGRGVVLRLNLFDDGGYLFFLAVQGVLLKGFIDKGVDDYSDGQNSKQQ
jgi:hypothetical protein